MTNSKLVLGLVLAAAALSGTAHAALQGRDLNGDTLVDAFYDTDLNITWRRNANLNGPMTWDNAVSWAENMTFGGYTDWRLPTTDTTCPLGDPQYNCTGSEMGHLWYVELANLAGDVTPNKGNFANMISFAYWSGTAYAPDASKAWGFNIDQGDQFFGGKENALYAMAVRPGDVTAAVPEPGTYALMLVGLTVVGFIARRSRA